MRPDRRGQVTSFLMRCDDHLTLTESHALRRRGIKITTRLILSFLAVSILPLTAVSYAGLQAMDQVSSTAIGESTKALKRLGEEAIYQKALDVAAQVEVYLRAHPEATLKDLQASKYFTSIALQKVGKTGYTALYEAGTGITRFHPNPALIDRDLSFLARDLPSWWAIYQPSLAGVETAGYYDWLEADQSIRQKYMVMLPVPEPSHGVTLMIAATTYIDEFSQPIRDTEAKIAQITAQTQRLLLIALIVVGLGVTGLALWLAWGISRPVNRLTVAAETLERGEYRPADLAAETARQDDLGQLSRVFDRMAREIKAREEHLRHEVLVLRIEIDETKRARQVAEITETEYFRALYQKAQLLRARGRGEV